MMEILGDFYNKEPKVTEIYAVVFLDRLYGHDRVYAYFTNIEKAEKWFKQHNIGLGGKLEIASIKVS